MSLLIQFSAILPFSTRASSMPIHSIRRPVGADAHQLASVVPAEVN